MAARDWTMATATVAGVRAGAGADLPMDCGGNFAWRDRDASNTVRMTLDSATGALWVAGNLSLGSGSGSPLIAVNGAAGGLRFAQFQTNGVARWNVGAGGGAEAGANAGSQFTIDARADNGAYIDTPLAITRAAGGAIMLSRPLAGQAATLTSLTTQGDVALGKADGTDGEHFLNIYGAAANKYGRLFTAGAGTSFQFESVGMGFGIASGGYVAIATAANQNMFFNAGDMFRWQDKDASSTDRMTLNSATGDLWVSGRITAQIMTLLALPTTNPGVAGQIWNDNGTLKVSAG